MTKAERLEAEIKRTELMKEFDREYKIYGTICGIDEAGRGPLCGPVVAVQNSDFIGGFPIRPACCRYFAG